MRPWKKTDPLHKYVKAEKEQGPFFSAKFLASALNVLNHFYLLRTVWKENESVIHSVLSNSLDCSPPGSSVHGILQARLLEWVTIPFSTGSSQSRNRKLFQFSSVQFTRSVLSVSLRPHECQASLSITNSWSLLKLMPIELVIPSSHLILCRLLLLLPPIPPSIRVFSNESSLHMRWTKYWSFSFSISPSNEHPGLISFRMDWLDLLAVQGTLKSLLQHHSSKASILRHSAFFTAQLSHPYMTTRKTIALIRQTFVGKVMSLLFNMLSRLVITFLPRSVGLPNCLMYFD